ncbi:hypothetical protein [Sinorhizobium meliloti]|uniref:hypothetical protein n=1 Tax=Rhizobium meliloti TaxID=382 RepID=UPI0003DD8C45|nr:hypothetical protein [Sinorhizobium meliloti]ARS70886.1 hypothetical protein SMRU11_28315 [Sinorhizobium meliloti RU11/001]RVM38519.1 hypothetical protein CN129_07640 [Sinorhizobium meliloti]
MEEPTKEERDEIAWRVLNAKADCALRLIEKVIDYLRNDDIKIPTMQIMARSTVSGKANDPGAAYALAFYTHEYAEALREQKTAYRLMREDWANDQRNSSKSEGER